MNKTYTPAVELAGRILLALMFLLAGIAKISGYAGTAAYMASAGVPGAILPLVIALEVGGAIAIIIGFQTRLVALALAGFSVVAAALFHSNFADPMQMTMFLKNVSVAGGFLILAANGPGSLSLDAKRKA
ncbi:MAG: DoxX family protein [Nevskia sp.]|nr:DoxX family protein [Nevskia sp.]